MNSGQKIRCASVDYRQGFIEVLPDVHPGTVNLEVWQVRSGLDLTGLELHDERLRDSDIVANVELELSADEARRLVDGLTLAIARLENRR